MITFKQYLNEVFDKPLKWNTTLKRENRYIIEFDYNYILYKVIIDADPQQQGDGISYDITLFADGSTNFTRENQPFKIYATLIDIVKSYFKQNKLKRGDRVYMISAHQDTGRIYAKFAKEFAKMYGGKVSNVGTRGSWKVEIQ